MILHIMLVEKFTADYINFLGDNFDYSRHYFVLVDYHLNIDDRLNEVKYNNFDVYDQKDFSRKNKKLVHILKNAEKIIIHGCFGIHFIIPFVDIRMLSKTYLIFWGGDIYKFEEKIEWNQLVEKIYRRVYMYEIKYAKGVATLVEGDYKILSQYVKPKGKLFKAIYPWERKNVQLLECIRTEKKMIDPYRILVGNSATKENRHREVFDYLECFKGENINIICPLSYGDEEYRNFVILEGKRRFGEKFIPILEYMSSKEYFELLNTCSVGIFNNNRQQAINNIRICGYFGAKLYLSSETAMWDEFIKAGFALNDVCQIKKMSFQEFISHGKADRKRNELVCVPTQQRATEIWQKIFED